MADINTLIDKSIERIQNLSQETERASDGVDQIKQFATTLDKSLTDKQQETLSSFEELESRSVNPADADE